MNESTVSSKFQTKLREMLSDAVVIKHSDKSMIGCLDTSVTYNKKTLWLEYKLVTHRTKGVVTKEFNSNGGWSPHLVAEASPTQYEMAKRLANAGHCWYLFWVLDYQALRKRVAYVAAWHPITGVMQKLDSDEVVDWVSNTFGNL